VVRAAAVRTLVRSVLGLRKWEMGGGDECGEEGRAPRPFIGSEREWGGRTGKGIERPMVAHQCRPSGSVGRDNRGVSGE
jgi:hypothetical protein